MMVVLKNCDIEIKFSENWFQCLVIENKELYRNIVYSFNTNTQEDYFIFSKNYVPCDFYKIGVYIANPIIPEMSNKKLISKIYTLIEDAASNDYYQELADIKTVLAQFAEKLASHLDFNVDYNCDADTKALIKLLDFKVERVDDSFAESLIQYIMLMHKYLNSSLFVIEGLHAFFKKEEIDLIYKTLGYDGVSVLCIENTYPRFLSSNEKMHIIDNDLCTIE